MAFSEHAYFGRLDCLFYRKGFMSADVGGKPCTADTFWSSDRLGICGGVDKSGNVPESWSIIHFPLY